MPTHFETAIYEMILDYDMQLDYSTITHKYHIYDLDNGLRVRIQGNAFDTIGQAGQWFIANMRYIDRLYLGHAKLASAYADLLKNMKK